MGLYRLGLALIFMSLVLSAISVSPPSQAGQTFRISRAKDLPTLDPHSLTDPADLSFLGNIYEGLVKRAPNQRLEPALAESWNLISATTWRFTLRRDVKFHNGASLDADDVVFSINRARQKNSALADRFSSIADVHRLDARTVQIITKTPQPYFLRDLSDLYVMDIDWTQLHKDALATISNGTGPFQTGYRKAEITTQFLPFNGWWSTARHDVDEVVLIPIAPDKTRLDALIEGKLDLIQNVPVSAIKTVRDNPDLKFIQVTTPRTVVLGMDQYRPVLPELSNDKRNPFLDPDVREAIAIAIDTSALIKNALDGNAQVAGGILSPAINGWSESFEQPRIASPSRAKDLLRKAGYANGFALAFDCPHLPEDSNNKLCDQIINMLNDVGIHLTRRDEVSQATALRIARFNSPLFLMSFAPPQPHADNVITLLLGTRPEFAEGKTTLPFQGGFNFGRYSNSRIDDLLPILVGEMDQDLRLKAMTEALRIHRQEVGYIPLYRPTTTWAARQEVSVYLSASGGIDLRSIRIEKK